jgi:hypothetical protein
MEAKRLQRMETEADNAVAPWRSALSVGVKIRCSFAALNLKHMRTPCQSTSCANWAKARGGCDNHPQKRFLTEIIGHFSLRGASAPAATKLRPSLLAPFF